MGQNTFLAREALESADQPPERAREDSPENGALLTIPPTLLAIADEVIE